jgi:hypothetical protein
MMMIRAMRLLLVLCLLAAPAVGAQVVETPQAFDSAGRLMAITPSIAARLELGPPAWRVVGDYTEARLYSIGGDAYVLAVIRRDGAVERYSLTGTDRAYLRERTSTLPPRFGARPERGDRNKFIRNQTILGLVVYAPAFADAITDDDAGGASAYLLMAGATFFGASQLARDVTITPAMRSLSTHGALHAALAGGTLVYVLGGGGNYLDEVFVDEESTDANSAGIFVGGIVGTAAGLYFGSHMTTGQAVATGFGADVSTLTMLGIILAAKGGGDNGIDGLNRGDAALLIAAAGVGYPAGYAYARLVPYRVTGGDVGTLWLSGLLGASTTGIFLAGTSPGRTATSLTLTGGFLGGLLAGDRIFVRRFDHTAGDAAQMALGGIAGGLIGLGIANLVDESDNGHLGMALFTAGAMGGVAVTHTLIEPGGDEGRFSSRLRLNPTGAALAAAGVRGRHPLVSIAF